MTRSMMKLPLPPRAKLEGPVMVFGAGGFIGINLMLRLVAEGHDVLGVSQNPQSNWRIRISGLPVERFVACDITDYILLSDLVQKVRPRTVFNLAAYGAYSKQREYRKIHTTNFNVSLDLLELLKGAGFSAYVYAGSSSEYGLNSDRPREESQLIPNSHYAVSKVAASYAIKYYGIVERLPVVNLRIYSAYGPWEEPDRLVPVLVSAARHGSMPPLVDSSVSRDFVHVDDVVTAFLKAAENAPTVGGRSFNIGTGRKTTIRQIASLARSICHVSTPARFGSMQNRNWDRTDWYADPRLAGRLLGWKAETTLKDGLRKVIQWQQEVDFDHAYWNPVRRA